MSTYHQIIETRFAGVLRSGAHAPDGHACALEAASIAKGLEWTDDPTIIGLPDLRPLNDARWSSDVVRTMAMIPVIEAYWDWATWSEAKRQRVIARVVIATVREIVAELPGLPNTVRAQCRAVTTINAARAAANAARAATASATARAAAYTAARAADAAYAADAANAAYANVAARAADAAYAADAANAAAGDAVLRTACHLWITAAQ